METIALEFMSLNQALIWFLEIDIVHDVCMCVGACVPIPNLLVNSSVM